MILPLAKNADILVQALGDEVLVYDLISHKAYSLNETSAKVYNACNGKTAFDELKRKYKFSDDPIHLTLDELKRKDLLEDYQSNHFVGLSRREVIKRVGLGSMIALPVIAALVAPSAANAASAPCSDGGSPNGQGTCPSGQRCSSGSCVNCVASGQPVPGGCFGATLEICCNGSCYISGPNINTCS